MGALVIRYATPDDAGAIDELTWMLWDWHHGLAPHRVLPPDDGMAAGVEPRTPNDREDFVLVAERDGHVLGYAKLIRRDLPRRLAYRPRSLLVTQMIAVRPEARRQGIGRELVESARAAAREYGVGTLQVPVLGFNREALAFYRALGFQDEFVLLGIEP